MKPKAIDVLTDLGHFISFGFGSGLSPKAPGTMGSIAAIPLFLLLVKVIPSEWMLCFIAFSFVVGIPICHRTGVWVGESDYGGIVWDEIVAMWLVMFFMPLTISGVVAVFLVFRIFDIWKPWPISIFDERFKNGFGVMADDLAAALLALLVLRVALYIEPTIFSF